MVLSAHEWTQNLGEGFRSHLYEILIGSSTRVVEATLSRLLAMQVSHTYDAEYKHVREVCSQFFGPRGEISCEHGRRETGEQFRIPLINFRTDTFEMGQPQWGPRSVSRGVPGRNYFRFHLARYIFAVCGRWLNLWKYHSNPDCTISHYEVEFQHFKCGWLKSRSQNARQVDVINLLLFGALRGLLTELGPGRSESCHMKSTGDANSPCCKHVSSVCQRILASNCFDQNNNSLHELLHSPNQHNIPALCIETNTDIQLPFGLAASFLVLRWRLPLSAIYRVCKRDNWP